MRRGYQIVAALPAIAVLCGCQTDSRLRRQPVDGAPLTAFESVEIARQADLSLAGAGEVDLVEELIYYRTMYSRTLTRLRDHYEQHGYAHKYLWAQSELEDIGRIRPYHYLADSEIPRRDLVSRDSIMEADELYGRACDAAEHAGHGTPALFNQEKMGQALALYKQVIREYPTSDKIDDAAFFCGELYKEYYKNQEPVAVQWYELAWTWNPATPHPARFQAAVLYDYRLHDRSRALELYRAVLAEEAHNKSNRQWAVERIKQLTGSGPVEGHRTTAISPAGKPRSEAAGQREPELPAE